MTNDKIKLFFKVLLICLSVSILGAAAIYWFYTHGKASQTVLAEAAEDGRRINFLILGVDDDGTRTDAIMAGAFNTKTGAVDLISIPRDTYVKMPEDRLEALRAEGKWVPADGVMKINAAYHYSGKIEYITAQVEELLGIEIDYYAKADLEAFRYVIDSIGGVQFDVPQRMYYTDPEQNLYIDLYPGMQTLSGSQAEQLVRYRKPDIYNPQSAGYPDGDIGRAHTQQAFMKAFITQAISGKNLLNTTGALVTTAFKYVETNFSIADMPRYVKYLKDFSPDKITSMSLPGDTTTIKGQSYLVVREPDAQDMIASVFHDGEIVEEPSQGKNIMVLNGGYTKGKANEVRKTLEAAGFTVSSIGDYSGGLKDVTRIYVKKRGQGADLMEFFNAAEILIEPQTDCDIRIVVGIGE